MSTPVPPHRASRDAANRQEPRAARTRERVLVAVREALATGSIDALSVSDLCRRAGIHRVTFYGHWPDARAAAVDAMTEVVDRLAAVDEASIAGSTDPIELARLYERTLVGQLARVGRDRTSYRQLVDSPLFEQGLRRTLEARVGLAIDAFTRAGVDVPGAGDGIAAAYLAAGVAAATLAWIRSEREDVDRAAAEVTAQLPEWWPRAER